MSWQRVLAQGAVWVLTSRVPAGLRSSQWQDLCVHHRNDLQTPAQAGAGGHPETPLASPDSVSTSWSACKG